MAHRGFLIGMFGAVGAALVSSLVFLAAGAGPAGAAFPGENGRIAFARYDADAALYSAGRIGDIGVMAPDGSDKKNLTNSALRDEYDPAFSPDGTQIAFVGCPQGRTCGLYTMGAAGADQRRIVDGGVGHYGNTSITGAPAWSPDGKKIAFESYRDVLVVNSDGSGKTNLTNDVVDQEGLPPQHAEPAWSPDGKKIAFATNRNGSCYYDFCQDYDVWVMDSFDGSGKKNLTDPYNSGDTSGDGSERSPAWAPNGDHLVFNTRASYTCNEEIYEIEATLNPVPFEYWTNLTRDPDPCEPGGPRSDNDNDPAYSPDGSKIAFEKGQPGGENVFVMAHDGSGKTNLTEDPILESFDPDWGPACASCPEVEVPPPDDTDPIITGPRPAPGSNVRDRTPTVRAVVRDAASELAETDIQLRVDGSFTGFSYDPATDRLSRVTKKLSYGRHTAKITVIDIMGNKAERTWAFKVVRR